MPTYLPTIPQPNDQLSVSQGQILDNFAAIQTFVDVNHVDFADATNQGKHKFVTFLQQAAIPVPGNSEFNMYCLDSIVSPGTPAMFLRYPGIGGTNYDFTTAGRLQDGWTRLPSGILLKWGRLSTGGTGTIVKTFASLTGPSFAQVYTMQITTDLNGAANNNFICMLTNLNSNVAFTVSSFVRTAANTITGPVTFYYLAIGL